MLIERRSKCQGFRVGVSTLLEKNCVIKNACMEVIALH
jgi:hypothetical protein